LMNIYSHQNPPPGRHPMSQRFHDLLKEIGELHDRKQSDYGRADDPFANVNGSAEWGIRPWVGAMLRATDKLKRLQKYSKEGNLANEGARDSFLDAAVYNLIACVLWEKEAEEIAAVVRAGLDRPEPVHNHGIDPSCRESMKNGKLVGDCLLLEERRKEWGARCNCAMQNANPDYGHSFDCAIREANRVDPDRSGG